MIPAYITFVVDNTRNIAASEISSIHSDDDDEYLVNYGKNLSHQNMTTRNNVMQDVITNLDDRNVNDDDTMETIAIIQTPEYNESSRMMMMLMDGFGFVDSREKEDYCCMNMNMNPNTNNFNSNYNSNYKSNYNYTNTSNDNTNTNIIDYECGSLFEDYDDAMFPSDTIITAD